MMGKIFKTEKEMRQFIADFNIKNKIKKILLTSDSSDIEFITVQHFT